MTCADIIGGPNSPSGRTCTCTSASYYVVTSDGNTCERNLMSIIDSFKKYNSPDWSHIWWICFLLIKTQFLSE